MLRAIQLVHLFEWLWRLVWGWRIDGKGETFLSIYLSISVIRLWLKVSNCQSRRIIIIIIIIIIIMPHVAHWVGLMGNILYNPTASAHHHSIWRLSRTVESTERHIVQLRMLPIDWLKLWLCVKLNLQLDWEDQIAFLEGDKEQLRGELGRRRLVGKSLQALTVSHDRTICISCCCCCCCRYWTEPNRTEPRDWPRAEFTMNKWDGWIGDFGFSRMMRVYSNFNAPFSCIVDSYWNWFRLQQQTNFSLLPCVPTKPCPFTWLPIDARCVDFILFQSWGANVARLARAQGPFSLPAGRLLLSARVCVCVPPTKQEDGSSRMVWGIHFSELYGIELNRMGPDAIGAVASFVCFQVEKIVHYFV